MSRLNKKGPMGQGPLTGRRMGRCTNYGANLKRNEDTSLNPPLEDLPENLPRGFGFGRRRGSAGRGPGLRRQNRFRGAF
jgi:hypothetical protein